jgi:hypothetical protein
MKPDSQIYVKNDIELRRGWIRPHPPPMGLRDMLLVYGKGRNSTRRFCARPAAVALEAAGRSDP